MVHAMGDNEQRLELRLAHCSAILETMHVGPLYTVRFFWLILLNLATIMQVGRGVDLKKIDASVKNRLNWHWLESKDNEGYFLSARMYECSVFLCRKIFSGSGAKSYRHPWEHNPQKNTMHTSCNVTSAITSLFCGLMFFDYDQKSIYYPYEMCHSCTLVHGIVLQEQWIWPIHDVLFHKLTRKKQCSLGDLTGVWENCISRARTHTGHMALMGYLIVFSIVPFLKNSLVGYYCSYCKSLVGSIVLLLQVPHNLCRVRSH